MVAFSNFSGVVGTLPATVPLYPNLRRIIYFSQTWIKTMQHDKFNLMQYCHDGNLVVTPKRGKAVMWYNHFVDEETGWLGEMDEYSLHGGCGLWSGVKWIANNWITSSDAPWAHFKSDHDTEDRQAGAEF